MDSDLNYIIGLGQILGFVLQAGQPVFDQGYGVFTIVTTEFAFNNSYLKVFRFNVRTCALGSISWLNLSGGERGMAGASSMKDGRFVIVNLDSY